MGYGDAARVAGWGAGLALALAGAAGAACRPDAVELRWPGGGAAFRVELAAEGLMNRAEMPVSAGMLFTYGTPEHAYYWMKNTLIPLDILFADESGRVKVIHERAIPGDLTPLDGGEGVAYVLEINGGLTARMGIPIGAEMRAAAMDQAEIGWTCAQ
jgi:uncharacterized protein